MTVAKEHKGKSEAHPYAMSTYRNQKHYPGMPMLEIRDLMLGVGWIGKWSQNVVLVRSPWSNQHA